MREFPAARSAHHAGRFRSTHGAVCARSHGKHCAVTSASASSTTLVSGMYMHPAIFGGTVELYYHTWTCTIRCARAFISRGECTHPARVKNACSLPASLVVRLACSPPAGASDAAACVGVALEVARVYAADPSRTLAAPLIVLLNGGEETFLQARYPPPHPVLDDRTETCRCGTLDSPCAG